MRCAGVLDLSGSGVFEFGEDCVRTQQVLPGFVVAPCGGEGFAEEGDDSNVSNLI